MTRFIGINKRIIAVDAVVMIDEPTTSSTAHIYLTHGNPITISDEQWKKLRELFSQDCTNFDS